MRVKLEDLLQLVGHDGSEVVNPEKEFPQNHRGFCLEEMIDPCMKLGWLPVVLDSVHIYDFGAVHHHHHFQFHLEWDGVLFGLGKAGRPHAVAYDLESGLIYDPNGSMYKSEEFDIGVYIPMFYFDIEIPVLRSPRTDLPENNPGVKRNF